VLQIPLRKTSYFLQWRNVPFQALFRTFVKSWLFGKVGFWPSPFRQSSKIPPLKVAVLSILSVDDVFLEHWQKGGWKVTFLKSQLFINVLDGWKGSC
jgi:hypothetical protein